MAWGTMAGIYGEDVFPEKVRLSQNAVSWRLGHAEPILLIFIGIYEVNGGLRFLNLLCRLQPETINSGAVFPALPRWS
jgi:hypothetical protein